MIEDETVTRKQWGGISEDEGEGNNDEGERTEDEGQGSEDEGEGNNDEGERTEDDGQGSEDEGESSQFSYALCSLFCFKLKYLRFYFNRATPDSSTSALLKFDALLGSHFSQYTT